MKPEPRMGLDDFDEGDSMSLCLDDGEAAAALLDPAGLGGRAEKLVDTEFFNFFDDDFDESDVNGKPKISAPGPSGANGDSTEAAGQPAAPATPLPSPPLSPPS
eukprot:CAMPEP_0117669686 /NCGR_PEP_ID=MMETSP0804-20121206/12284_1 /TAXON_ID=1074897 /ORGANISM="Tetraselmis astigmatica, Strain CCMP880" /LENGTH=103 /DNA_ID=CAMNT_0005477799 /DNA_START=168 /DNA_END=480 /DNA_ORIENTATION=+